MVRHTQAAAYSQAKREIRRNASRTNRSRSSLNFMNIMDLESEDESSEEERMARRKRRRERDRRRSHPSRHSINKQDFMKPPSETGRHTQASEFGRSKDRTSRRARRTKRRKASTGLKNIYHFESEDESSEEERMARRKRRRERDRRRSHPSRRSINKDALSAPSESGSYTHAAEFRRAMERELRKIRKKKRRARSRRKAFGSEDESSEEERMARRKRRRERDRRRSHPSRHSINKEFLRFPTPSGRPSPREAAAPPGGWVWRRSPDDGHRKWLAGNLHAHRENNETMGLSIQNNKFTRSDALNLQPSGSGEKYIWDISINEPQQEWVRRRMNSDRRHISCDRDRPVTDPPFPQFPAPTGRPPPREAAAPPGGWVWRRSPDDGSRKWLASNLQAHRENNEMRGKGSRNSKFSRSETGNLHTSGSGERYIWDISISEPHPEWIRKRMNSDRRHFSCDRDRPVTDPPFPQFPAPTGRPPPSAPPGGWVWRSPDEWPGSRQWLASDLHPHHENNEIRGRGNRNSNFIRTEAVNLHTFGSGGRYIGDVPINEPQQEWVRKRKSGDRGHISSHRERLFSDSSFPRFLKPTGWPPPREAAAPGGGVNGRSPDEGASSPKGLASEQRIHRESNKKLNSGNKNIKLTRSEPVNHHTSGSVERYIGELSTKNNQQEWVLKRVNTDQGYISSDTDCLVLTTSIVVRSPVRKRRVEEYPEKDCVVDLCDTESDNDSKKPDESEKQKEDDEKQKDDDGKQKDDDNEEEKEEEKEEHVNNEDSSDDENEVLEKPRGSISARKKQWRVASMEIACAIVRVDAEKGQQGSMQEEIITDGHQHQDPHLIDFKQLSANILKRVRKDIKPALRRDSSLYQRYPRTGIGRQLPPLTSLLSTFSTHS